MSELKQIVGRRTAAATVTESITVPIGSGYYLFALEENPQRSTPSTVEISGLTEVEIDPVDTDEFYVDYTTSEIKFLKGVAEQSLTVSYNGLGMVARSTWANQQTTWQSRDYFIIGQPEDAVLPATNPTGIIFFPNAWVSSLTVKRITVFAQSIVGISDDTTIVISNLSDYTSLSADTITATLTHTGAATDYWASATGTIDVPLTTGGSLYIRATGIGGHGNIMVSVYPA